MALTHILNKPEYWFRPSQIVRKARFAMRKHHGGDSISVRLPWKDRLLVQPGDAIGRSVLTLGVHELAVSEVLWRLADPGDVCLDVGANLGYMTSLLGAKVGSTGRVFCFEPHPAVFARLEANMNNSLSKRWLDLRNEAIGATDGSADLVESADFKTNEGVASLVSVSGSPKSFGGARHTVIVRRLDSVFSGDETFGVMKVDVEGAEQEVFRGAEHLLTEQAIRDIVWEDHQPFPSGSVQLLAQYGYRIYRFAKSFLGPAVWNPFVQDQVSHLPWETINYLGTLDSARAEERLSARGWRCLRG